MTKEGWEATVRVSASRSEVVDRLARTLAPEAVREVPRARTRLERPSPTELAVQISARDTGAVRAGLNTFLGWIDLVAATERVAAREQPP